jgi:hypothetical protein
MSRSPGAHLRDVRASTPQTGCRDLRQPKPLRWLPDIRSRVILADRVCEQIRHYAASMLCLSSKYPSDAAQSYSLRSRVSKSSVIHSSRSRSRCHFPCAFGRVRPMRPHLLYVEFAKVQIAPGRGFAVPARISNCCTNVLGVVAGGLELFECQSYRGGHGHRMGIFLHQKEAAGEFLLAQMRIVSRRHPRLHVRADGKIIWGAGGPMGEDVVDLHQVATSRIQDSLTLENAGMHGA